MLEEEHRIVILDRAAQQPVGVVDAPRADDLEPGRADEEPLGAARVKRPAPHTAAERRADHDGQLDAAAPVRLGAHGHDRVEGARDEVRELQLGDRSLPHPGRPERGADEALLGDRRVDHALGAEFLQQPLGDAERPAEVADVLAYEEHPLVLAHGIRHRRANRLEVGDLGHGATIPARPSESLILGRRRR